MDMNKRYNEYFKNNDKLTIPQMMSELGLGYAEANDLIGSLETEGLCVSDINGKGYIVDRESIDLRVIEDDECMLLSESFDHGEEIFLSSLCGDRHINDVGRAAFAGKGECAAIRCVELGLAHIFDGKYRLSVSHESVIRINEYKQCERNDNLLVKLAHPIMVKCAEAGDMSADVLDSPMLDRMVKEYIKSNIDGYIGSDAYEWAQRRLRGKCDTFALTYSMADAVILHYDYDSVDEYVREAQEANNLIQCSGYANDLICSCALEAVEVLKHTNMQHIKLVREINSRQFLF